jgi:predicted transcriptional regulator
MKTITVNVSEPVYQEFQDYAQRNDRKTAELIREAMEDYRRTTIGPARHRSLRQLEPARAGRVLQPLSGEDDLAGEMIDL